MSRMQIVSTYRLQFHKGFTFADATAIVPYLHELGITHVYASPYLKAVAGSTHGYDVIDHSHLNPEIGTRADYQHFVAALAEHGMSHILDTVPNHMGVDTNDNHWWNDVLASGEASPYAKYFDIDWNGFTPRKELVGKVLLPVLGETCAEAIESELLEVEWEGAKPFISYRGGRRFPLNTQSHAQSDVEQDVPRLLADQHYRLAYWRVAADEINYRRFFDITSLAALQMQRQEVFDDAHRFTFQLIAEGSVAGLRVDHPDGLLDPKEYFDRLQTTYASSCPQQSADGKPLYVAVEKILNGDETLCDDWSVAGTSGYDFLCAVNDLYVNPINEPAMTAAYIAFVGDQPSYADCVYREKGKVLDNSMCSEMTSLTSRLDALAQLELSSRDFTRRQLGEALREAIACFPVYRSYISARGVGESDVAVVEQAINAAKAHHPKVDPSVWAFIRDSILLRYPATVFTRNRQLEFAQRFQQLTAPVNAKGIEDSTFYIYNRLISLNEVGGDPGRFGRESHAIHRYFERRQKRWPLAMSSLSTHDTKRSEDVRARLNVLSEIPDEWAQRLALWKEVNAGICIGVHPNDLYLLYQTLLGAWPLEPIDNDERKIFKARITAYMQKALREAKVRSSWVDPDQAYEATVARVIRDLINPDSSGAFLKDFLEFQKKVSRIGLLNSLSQTVLHLTAPGISDTYQGSELWDFSLVDPDNRRPVDYARRKQLLEGLQHHRESTDLLQTLTGNMEDGRIKLWVIQRLSKCRRQFPEVFLSGSYEPLQLHGPLAANAFAFARRLDDRQMIVIVPRLIASMVGEGKWVGFDWENTHIKLSKVDFGEFDNVLTDERCSSQNGELHLGQLLRNFPVAVLMRTALPALKI